MPKTPSARTRAIAIRQIQRRRRHLRAIRAALEFEPPDGGPSREPIDQVLVRWWAPNDLAGPTRPIVLFRSAGWAYATIADEFGLSPAIARRRWAAARRALLERVAILAPTSSQRAAFELLARGGTFEQAGRALGAPPDRVRQALARALLDILRNAEPEDVAVRRCWEEDARRGTPSGDDDDED